MKVVLIQLMCCPFVVMAQTQDDSLSGGRPSQTEIKWPPIPETPAGKAFAKWIKVINTGDYDAIHSFHADNPPPYAVGNPKVIDLLTFVDYNLYLSSGGFDLFSLRQSTNNLVLFLCRERITGFSSLVGLTVPPAPPYFIDGVIYQPSPTRLPGDTADLNIRKVLKKLSDADLFSGAVLFTERDTTTFKKAYGLASKSLDVPNRLDTKFNLASMSKMFTGVAVAQLAQQGKLRFSDTIITHLPDYPNRAVAEKVTIHQLLTHTSGLGDFFNEKYAASWFKLREVQDYFPLFVDDPLLFEPGQGWNYSSAGYIVLGAIIEKVSGQNYFDYIREHIYKPAGMLDSDSFEVDQDTPNLAIGYTRLGVNSRAQLEARKNNLLVNGVKGNPGGGSYSTLEDMLKFSVALRNHTLLNPEYTNIVLTGKVDLPGPPGQKAGYGFFEQRFNGKRFVGHDGASNGVSTQFLMDPDGGDTIIVLSNYDHPIAAHILNRILQATTTSPR